MLGQKDPIFQRSIDTLHGQDRADILAEKLANQNQKNQIDTTPKEEPKPLSVSLLDKQITAKDLMARLTEKSAKSKIQSSLESFSESISDKIDSNVESFFGTDISSMIEDSPQLSQQGRASGAVSSKERKATLTEQSADTWDLILNTETPAANGADGPDAPNQINQPLPGADISDLADTLKTYLATYAMAMATEDPQKKKEAKALQSELLDAGLPAEKLIVAEHNVKKAMYNDLKNRIRDTLVHIALVHADSKGDKFVADKTSQLVELKKLGEKMGIDAKEINNMGKENRDEIKTFLFHELDRSASENLSKNNEKKLNEAFIRYDKLSRLIGANPKGYFQKFNQKIDDLGLKPFFTPSFRVKEKLIDNEPKKTKTNKLNQTKKLKKFFKGYGKGKVNTKSKMEDAQADRRHRNKFSQNDDNQNQREEELFNAELEGQLDAIAFEETSEEQIRALYIQKWIRRDLQSRIKIHFQLNRLLRESKISQAKHLKAQEDAKILARYKLLDLLREAFEEKATLANLSGPQYHLIKDKFKLALGGLTAMGNKLSKTELDNMRDLINKNMFSIIRDDYIKVEIYLEGNPPETGYAKQKRAEYLAILTRLKAESNIPDDIRPKSFQDITLKSDITVIDVA